MQYRIELFILAGILSLSSVAASAPEALYSVAPTKTPGVSRIMKTAGFWIGRHPDPDRLIMDSVSVQRFNDRLRDAQLGVYDLRRIPNPFDGDKIRRMIQEPLRSLKTQVLYDAKGEEVGEKFYRKIEKNLNLEKLLMQKDLDYAFVTRFADQRLLPTERALHAKQHDIDFDELQNSGLDIGTPVLVLHTSRDRKWCFVLSEISGGWVKRERIAAATPGEFQSFLGARQHAVVTVPKADIFLDVEMKEFHDHARMGTKFPLLKDDDETAFMIMIPRRTDKGRMESAIAYVAAAQVSPGFLPYTPRTIFEQAFKLLNAPYGWGDLHGEQDCSRFLQEVFATAGIILPRNSKDQAMAGKMLASFDDRSAGRKIAALRRIDGGGTLLTMKGHIMLYLGMIEDKPYAIHSVWAYRQPRKREDDLIRVMNRVSLSDLFLGEGSQKGSLIERMNGIVEVTN